MRNSTTAPSSVGALEVSPVWATETLAALGMDATPKMPAAQFVRAHKESVEKHRSGEVLGVRNFVRQPLASETWFY